MNNPFLSDRNIFSKVVNPLKKKPQGDKKQQIKPAPLPEKYKESKVQPYNNQYKYQKPVQNKYERPTQFSSKTNSASLNNQKMTFGVPQLQQRRQQPDRKYINTRQEEYDSQSSGQIQEIYDYRKNDSYKFPQNKNTTQNDKYKPASTRQIQISTPKEQIKFQQFRKRNNMNDYSPITAPQRTNESEFLNIDALGDDLNKFLAESKNQEELCKILGIQRTNRKQDTKQKQLFQSNKYQYQNKAGLITKSSTPYQVAQFTEGFKTSKEDNQKVPNIFRKQRKVQIAKTQSVPFKPQQSQKNEYIPTFNYVGLDLQNSTTSRHEQELERVKAIVPNDKKTVVFESKKDKVLQDVDNLQVFNYSKVSATKKADTLEEKIARQMQQLSINGKYRTFLSASQKIVAYKYTMEVL